MMLPLKKALDAEPSDADAKFIVTQRVSLVATMQQFSIEYLSMCGSRKSKYRSFSGARACTNRFLNDLLVAIATADQNVNLGIVLNEDSKTLTAKF